MSCEVPTGEFRTLSYFHRWRELNTSAPTTLAHTTSASIGKYTSTPRQGISAPLENTLRKIVLSFHDVFSNALTRDP